MIPVTFACLKPRLVAIRDQVDTALRALEHLELLLTEEVGDATGETVTPAAGAWVAAEAPTGKRPHRTRPTTDLTVNQERVLTLLRKADHALAFGVLASRLTGMSVSAVRDALTALRKAGIVTAIGETSARRYRLVQPGAPLTPGEPLTAAAARAHQADPAPELVVAWSGQKSDASLSSYAQRTGSVRA